LSSGERLTCELLRGVVEYVAPVRVAQTTPIAIGDEICWRTL
jgi:hypothetical protein